MNTWEVGALAETIAFFHERSLAAPADIERIRLVSNRVRLGYDMESVSTMPGFPAFKAIEVKAWNSDGYFIISKNELEVLRHLGRAGWIYLVDVTKRRVVEEINDPFGRESKRLRLEPCAYRCRF
jgi:hypothetical protein